MDKTPRATIDGVGDHVDRLVEEWLEQRPDVDTSPMEVVARLSRLSRILERRIEELYASFGLNQSQFGVLAALRRSGPPYRLSPTELYNALLVTSGAMTNRLDRLQAADLIERTRDPDDGRGMLVALTPAGKRLIDRILVPHYENESLLLAALPPKEQEKLATLLRRLLLWFEDASAAGANDDVAVARSSRRPRAASDRPATRDDGNTR
jgi:DNA-binding MarR family transcriptional regulator